MFGLITKKKAKRVANESELKGIERGAEIGYRIHQSLASGDPVLYITGRPLDKDIQEDIEEICRKENF